MKCNFHRSVLLYSFSEVILKYPCLGEYDKLDEKSSPNPRILKRGDKIAMQNWLFSDGSITSQ